MVAKVFATLGEEHGEARAAALKAPKIRDRERYLITGLKPAKYCKEKPAARPPAHVLADRDRRATLLAQCTDLNVLLTGARPPGYPLR